MSSSAIIALYNIQIYSIGEFEYEHGLIVKLEQVSTAIAY